MILTLLAAALAAQEPADLVLTNGRVVTMARVEAEPVEALAALKCAPCGSP